VAISYIPQNKEIPTVAMLLRNDDLLYTPKVYNSEKNKNLVYLTLKMTKMVKVCYEAPTVEMCEVCVEQGFSVSGGSTIENVGARATEEEWD
jgi:hypothetical protein